MKRFKIVIVVIAIALGCVVAANAFAGDKGRNKVMGYCFDAAFHEKTNRLFVAGGVMGTHVFEVTNGKLNFVTTVFDGGYHRNLKISGDRAYVAYAKRGLVVFDIAEKVPVCTWKQQEQRVTGMGIYIHDNHAYLAAGAEGLHIFDISTPDSPKVVGKCETNADAWDVWVSGKYAYIADLQKGITVIDVSRPYQPQKVSLVTWDKEKPMAEIVRGEGKIAYVAAGKHGLVVIDVSNPQDPKVVSQYKSGPKAFGEGLCVRKGLVYLSNGNNNNKDENGLIIIDARNPNSLKVSGKCTFGGWVEGVCLAGNHVFITNTSSGVRSIDISDPNNPRLVDSFGPIKGERLAASDTFLETEISQQEREIIEYFEKTKKQIFQGRKFNDLSTAANAFLTLISAYYHQDQNTLEQILPLVRQFKKLSSPEQRSKMLDGVRKSIVCRIKVENKSPEESDLCAIYTSASPDKQIDQAWSFGYVEGAWRFVGSTSEIDSWLQSAGSGAEMTRKVLRQQKKGAESDCFSKLEMPAPRERRQNRLVAWWKLDEADGNDVADSSDNGCLGRLIGNPQWQPAGGKVNGALAFDGVGDFVEIGNEPAFDLTGAITIAAWIKVNKFDKRWQAIVTKGDTAWRIQRTAAEDTLVFKCTGIESTRARMGIEGNKSVNDGKWHHVVGVYDGSTVSLYIDGVLDDSGEASGSIQTNDSPVFIGANSEVSGREWNGLIDEVCVFACALDADNVSALYTGRDPMTIAKEVPTPGESTVNRVLSLDGEEDYVRVADSQSLRSLSGAITIEVWFKVSSFYADDGSVNSIIRKNITPGAENFFLRFRNVAGKPAVEMSIGYDIEILRAPYEFAVGTWYYLAGTYDGSAITVFVNGVSIKSEKVSGPLYIDQSELFIGKGDPEFSFGEYFHGALDEIRIWNVARSQEEIRTAMNTPLTGKEKGLVAYWNFDEGTAKDLSPHDNDGVLNGDAQIVESPRPTSLAPQEKKTNELVAWWKFDNTASDSAGASHGTTQGNPTYVPGKLDQAISLDGDDYVDCGNSSVLNFGTGDWTISAWIKTTQTGTDEDDALMNRGTVFANGGDETGGIRYTLAVNEARLGKITLTTDDELSKVQAISSTAVNDGAWHHVVGMRNGKELRLYVDGVLDGTNTLPAGFNLSGASQQNAYVGVIADNRDSSLYKYFVGLIDEVCVFACALDGSSVSALYSGRDPIKVAAEAMTVAPAQASQEQFQDRISGTSHIATALILVLGLAGLIGAIILFLVKSSIR